MNYREFQRLAGSVPTNGLVSSERSLFTGWPETSLWDARGEPSNAPTKSQLAMPESPAFDRIAFAYCSSRNRTAHVPFGESRDRDPLGC